MVEQPEGEQQGGTTMGAALWGRVVEGLSQLASTARAGAAFGEPHTVGERTVIPAAEVMCAVGFGMGGGEGAPPGGTAGSGVGGGGGGGARSRPVAAIVVERDRVYVQPIVDVTQIWLAAITAGIISLFWLKGALRRGGVLEKGIAIPSPRALARLMRPR